MNDILLNLKNLFGRLLQGDLTALGSSSNAMWLAIGVVVCVVLILVRRLTKPRQPAASVASSPTTSSPVDLEVLLRQPGENGVFGSLTDALASQLPESQKERSEFRQLLRQAGLYSRTARVSIYALRFVGLFVPVVAACVMALAAPRDQIIRILVIGGSAAALFSILPRLYVFFRRRRRINEINNGLSDMMDMLSMCLGGGMPLSPALDHVAHNLTTYPSLAEELLILKRQAEVGSLKRALADFAERIDLPPVRQVAGLLARGEQLGNRLSKSLLEQADHFRSTRRQLATMQANKTPVILTLPLMFCFAPAVLIMLMAPTMLQLTEFLRPAEGGGVLGNNQNINISAVTRLAEGMDNATVDMNAQWRRNTSN